jgi:SAM-dependent methyltransferase
LAVDLFQSYNRDMSTQAVDTVTETEVTPETLGYLFGEDAAEELAALAHRDVDAAQTVPLLAELRRRHSPEIAGALLTQARLRRRAQDKFPSAHRLFFTAEALEQATTHAIADVRAAWIDRFAPPGPVLDLGCGIGGDTLALARYRPVIAYETSPTRLRFAQANAAALGLAHQVDFRLADWTADLTDGRLPAAAAAFADPARRVDGRRVFSLHQMQPPISLLLQLQAQIPALGVKVAPGVHDDEIPQGCHVLFVSHARTCKEGVLWFGPLRGDALSRWALVHDGSVWHRLDASLTPPPVGSLSVGHILYEPDPALIRAGCFAELCQRFDAHLFDPQIAYLVGERPVADDLVFPLAQRFQIEEILPNSLKALNRRLKALGVGSVELKKRGSPIEPESLRPRLTLTPGGRAAVVFFTRCGDQRLTVLARRVGMGDL